MRRLSTTGPRTHHLLFVCTALQVIGTAFAQGLSAPTLVATPTEGHTVALEWTDSEGYATNRIERRSGGSDWILISERGQASSYWDRTTVAGVAYTYRVQAITLDGRFTYSNEASALTTGPTLNPPPAPNLGAQVAFNSFELRWLPIAGATEYQLDVMDENNPWHDLVTLDGNSSNYLFTPLIEGMTYHFRIRAFNHAGASPYAVLPITAPYDPDIIPPTPTIHATTHTDTSITLQWDHTPQAWGYQIESRTNPSAPWVQITNVGRETTSIVHENLSPSTEYSYRIRSYNGAGESAFSSVSTASTYPPPPASPQLRGFPVSYKEIELRWTDVLTNSTTVNGSIGYRLEMWNGIGFLPHTFAGVDDTNHVVGGLEPSTEYSFRIVALHPLASEWSTNTVRTMDPPPIPPPSAPSFYAEPHSSTTIELKWFKADLATEYRLERENYPGGGVWQQIATVPAISYITSYIDRGLQPTTLYVYRIRAANSYGTSPYSNEAAASTRPPPEIPLLRVGATKPTEVYLFVQPAENATLYRLERLNQNGEWHLIHESDSAPFGFTDTELTPFTPYTYRVGARSPAGTWHYSATATTQTWPLTFTATARPLSSSAIELSWPHLPHVDHFFIQTIANGVWDWRNDIETDGAATNHLFTGLSADTSYTYRIYATNPFGRSPESQVTARTHPSISGDIVIRSITPADAGANYRLRLTGSTGQKFKLQSTPDFQAWTDRTDPLSLTTDIELTVPSLGSAAFYRTIKVD